MIFDKNDTAVVFSTLRMTCWVKRSQLARTFRLSLRFLPGIFLGPKTACSTIPISICWFAGRAVLLTYYRLLVTGPARFVPGNPASVPGS